MLPVKLFGTSGCHLCASAQILCQEFIDRNPDTIALIPVDISEGGEMLQQYAVRIPVLKRVDTDAELDWPFDSGQLECFLR